MTNFPYKGVDLMRKGDFIRYCLNRGYRVNDSFLKFLKDEKFIIPPTKFRDEKLNKDFDLYSKNQFYLVQKILEERYEEYFFRTFFSYSDDIKKYHKETQEHLKDFDKEYFQNILPFYIDFFNLLDQLKKEYSDFRKEYFSRLNKISENDVNITIIDSNGTAYKDLIRDVQSKYNDIDYAREKTVLDRFIIPMLAKYKKYVTVYNSMQGTKDFFKIPEVKIVRDFIEDILVIVEWFFDTRNIPFDRLVTQAQIGDWCTMCGKNFKRIRYNQKTCGGECARAYKNKYRREKRKTDKGYGRSFRELKGHS